MNADEVELNYVHLRELAYEDPVATKNKFLAVLDEDKAAGLALLQRATDTRGARFRQIVARALNGRKAIDSDTSALLAMWRSSETDEFALTAISDAIASFENGSKGRLRKKPRSPQPLELEGTYRYVSGRLRHRVLNALPGAGMAIQQLRFSLSQSNQAQVVADLTAQLDALFAHLARLQSAVAFDEESTYFHFGSIPLARWLRDHQNKFSKEYGLISVDLNGLDDGMRVYATPYWLETIFTNLWKNAIDAVSPSSCEVKLSAERQSQELRLTVADNGPGFLSADVERAFQFQFSTKDKDRGRGLMEVLDAMERLGGTARVAKTDRGYRVQLIFPEGPN